MQEYFGLNSRDNNSTDLGTSIFFSLITSAEEIQIAAWTDNYTNHLRFHSVAIALSPVFTVAGVHYFRQL